MTEKLQRPVWQISASADNPVAVVVPTPVPVAGVDNNGVIRPAGSTYAGDWKIKISEPLSAFGELSTIVPTPIVQADFIYNVINPDMVTTASLGLGAISQSNSMAILSTGAQANSLAQVYTNRRLKYRPGQGAVVRATAIFDTGTVGNYQLLGAGDATEGLFVGYSGSNFSTYRFQQFEGEESSHWTTQENFNIDTLDGSGSSGMVINPQKGNVYQIKFQWLGFGQITYYVEDPEVGEFIPFHRIKYANVNDHPSLKNPSFPITAITHNVANDTDVTMKVPCLTAFIEGPIEYLGPKHYEDADLAGIGTTYLPVMTIRNKTAFGGNGNHTMAYLTSLTVAVDGNKPAQYVVVKNAALTGASYADYSPHSLIEIDTTATALVVDEKIDGGSLGRLDNIQKAFEEGKFPMAPGEAYTIAVRATASTTDASVGIGWLEDF